MSNYDKRRHRITPDWVIGRLALILSIAMAVVFGVALISTKMLPGKFLAIIFVALALTSTLIGCLVWMPRYRVRYVIGLFMTVLVCVLYGFGSSYIFKGVSTAKDITTVRTETAAVGIYVRASDNRDFAQMAGNYSYGILAEQDRENTDEAIAQLEQEYGVMVSTRAYAGLSQLIDGILGSEVDAIIMNSAYLELLSEMEGYETAAEQLREVQVQHVEREVVVETPQEQEIPADRLVGTVNEEESGDAQDGMIFTMFISGIDNRGALIAKSRSDVNILAAVNTATRQVALISTPRDYYVPLSISGGARDKLTHAGIYGVNVCMDTLAMLYNVNVDYYFRVNFGGFQDIIDALGGVTVNSEVSFTTDGYSFVQGENYVNGTQALAFVRERYAFASGDRQRGRNQMAMIKAVINKALSPELLVRYNSLMDALQGSFETSIPYDTLSSIVRQQLDEGGSWNIVSYSADGTGDSQIPYSMSQYAYVMIPDESTVATAKNLIAQVYNGEILGNS